MRLRLLRVLTILFLFSGLSVQTTPAKADQAKEFILSCTYGVLAGTLVGAATLAFSDKPGDSLNKVARGASLGLYAGILLGAYVTYGSGGPSEEDEEALKAVGQIQRKKFPPRIVLQPLFNERGNVAGAHAAWTVVRF